MSSPVSRTPPTRGSMQEHEARLQEGAPTPRAPRITLEAPGWVSRVGSVARGVSLTAPKISPQESGPVVAQHPEVRIIPLKTRLAAQRRLSASPPEDVKSTTRLHQSSTHRDHYCRSAELNQMLEVIPRRRWCLDVLVANCGRKGTKGSIPVGMGPRFVGLALA